MKTAAPARVELPAMIRACEAAELTGKSLDALRCWIRYWNHRHPDCQIRRTKLLVHAGDLQRALETDMARCTPVAAVARALESQATRSRGEAVR